MNNDGVCLFNFSNNRVKNKINGYEEERQEIGTKLKDIAILKKIKYFDSDRSKSRKELEATKDPDVLILLKRFNKLNDSIVRLNGLLDNILKQQECNIYEKSYSRQKYEYKLNINGRALLKEAKLPSSEPDYVFSLTDYYKPVFSKTYEIKGTINESFIVKTEDDRMKILLNKDVEEVLFLGDKAFIKRVDNMYLVKNEMTGILEWSNYAYGTMFSNSQNSLGKDCYQNLECIYKSVPFIKSDWLGKEIRESKDLNDRTPWEDFYKTVDTSGKIRII